MDEILLLLAALALKYYSQDVTFVLWAWNAPQDYSIPEGSYGWIASDIDPDEERMKLEL